MAQESKEICKILNIEDVNETLLSKKEYIKLMKIAAADKNKQFCEKLSEGKEKCSKIKEEEYGKKGYISDKKISEVRHWFKTRYKMQPFASNYSRDKKYAKTEWLCKCKLYKESEEHLRDGTCQVYGSIRKKYGNQMNDEELVMFFKEILNRREEMEQETDETTADEPLVHASSSETGDKPVWGREAN